jgi:hypothetical protein
MGQPEITMCDLKSPRLATGFRGLAANRIVRTVAETFVAYQRGELPMKRVFDGPDALGLRN